MKLFFSYSRAQAQEVTDLVDFLSIYHDWWFDKKIDAGTEWWKEILSQIRDCDVFVFVLSDDSNCSKACLAELDYADRLGKHRIILQVDEIDPAFFPPVLKADNVTGYLASDMSRKNKLLRSLKEIEDKKLYVWSSENYGNIEEPPLPISDLSVILSEIQSKETLSVDEQERILNRLERLRAKKTEKEENIIRALEQFKMRDDINYLVGTKIDALLNKGNKSNPTPISNGNHTVKNISFILRDVIAAVANATDDGNIAERLENKLHNPNNIFGRWRRARSVQNNQNLPIYYPEVIIFNNNFSFQLIQNNMQTNFGSFMYNLDQLTIYFINGAIDTRSFQCFETELYIVQYMNNIPFNIDCYLRV